MNERGWYPYEITEEDLEFDEDEREESGERTFYQTTPEGIEAQRKLNRLASKQWAEKPLAELEALVLAASENDFRLWYGTEIDGDCGEEHTGWWAEYWDQPMQMFATKREALEEISSLMRKD